MASTAKAKTRTRTKSFGTEVRRVDPTYWRDRHRSIEYDFRDKGGGVFYGDPDKRGIYTPEE